ncbi:MFS transporter [Bacillaceae bacterium SIJ1]|uniref:MFS transporter n=1 Tax=Litoribacterium kuwaitense TaxID=1398745 RepID=UPI0013ED666B|nr:MFS transporter [Litoribacterium kuwaitense]NGP44669.1 MFS transporter [Litoribacterium kuwaitense]
MRSLRSRFEQWAIWKTYGWTATLLLILEFCITFTFFMFVPFISMYMTGGLGLSITFAGVLLAVRLIAQQGLMLFGGFFGDRFGYRKMMIIGFLCRGVGFAGLGLVTTPAWLLIMATIGGLGGALFSPSLRSILIADQPKHVHKTLFSIANMSGNAGTIIGPLVGSLFPIHYFPVLSVVVGAFFALFSILVWKLPAQPVIQQTTLSFQTSVKELLQQRPFLIAVFCMIPFHFIYQQLFLTYPLVAQTMTGSGGWIFSVVTVLVVVFQLWVTRRTKHYSIRQSLFLGYGIIILSTIPLMVHEGLWSLVISLVGMAGGVMVMQPAFYTYAASRATAGTLAMYLGFSNLAMAVGGALGNTAGGSLYEQLSTGGNATGYWIVLGAVCLLPLCVPARWWKDSSSGTTVIPKEKTNEPMS